jgi:hypothetical protein
LGPKRSNSSTASISPPLKSPGSGRIELLKDSSSPPPPPNPLSSHPHSGIGFRPTGVGISSSSSSSTNTLAGATESLISTFDLAKHPGLWAAGAAAAGFPGIIPGNLSGGKHNLNNYELRIAIRSVTASFT